MIRRVYTIVRAFLLAFVAIAAGATEPVRIVVFTPTTAGNTYWPQVYEILEDAADDLGVELLAFEFDVRDRFAKAEDGVRILRSVGDVDGAIFSVAFGQTLPLLDVTEELGIPVIIQGPLFEEERAALGGGPRREYASWVGLFAEDEVAKGRELARVLLEIATAGGMIGPDGDIDVVGLGGDPSWFGSALRAAGLEDAIADEERARLLQVVPTYWTEAEGYEITRRLMTRYPRATVIWAASDQLAIGASRALRETGLRVGEDVVVGGLDLSERGLAGVLEGTLTATSASPLFGFARVLTYLYDYVQGKDFAPITGTVITLPVQTATLANAADLLGLYRRHHLVDYRALSRAYTPSLSRYDFSPDRLRESMVQ